jgi:hypothetical protein
MADSPPKPIDTQADDSSGGPDDRRRAPRHRVHLPGTLPFDQGIRILDISLSGIAVESTHRLVPGRTYQITIPTSADEPVKAEASVVWCKLMGTRRDEDDVLPVFRAGMSFAAELPDTGRRMLDELDQVSPQGIGTRLQARFRMSERLSAFLGGDTSFEVRVISRHGLAAVMEYKPKPRSRIELLLAIGDREVEVTGVVVDVIERGEEIVVGIEYVDLPPVTRAALEDYLAELAESG